MSSAIIPDTNFNSIIENIQFSFQFPVLENKNKSRELSNPELNNFIKKNRLVSPPRSPIIEPDSTILCDKCNVEIQSNNWFQHSTTECSKRLVACPHQYCNVQTIPYDQLKQHESDLKGHTEYYKSLITGLLQENKQKCSILINMIQTNMKLTLPHSYDLIQCSHSS